MDDRSKKLDNNALWDKIHRGAEDADMAYAVLQTRAHDALTAKQSGEPVILSGRTATMIVNLVYADRPQPKRKRGRDPRANRDRNIWIVGTVKRIAERYGFPPTRNRSSASISACAIAATALQQLGLNLTEFAVEKVWEARQI